MTCRARGLAGTDHAAEAPDGGDLLLAVAVGPPGATDLDEHVLHGAQGQHAVPVTSGRINQHNIGPAVEPAVSCPQARYLTELPTHQRGQARHAGREQTRNLDGHVRLTRRHSAPEITGLMLRRPSRSWITILEGRWYRNPLTRSDVPAGQPGLSARE